MLPILIFAVEYGGYLAHTDLVEVAAVERPPHICVRSTLGADLPREAERRASLRYATYCETLRR